MQEKVAIILQARMNSKRLPSKVMADLGGRSLILFEIERLKKCVNVDEIIVATTKEKTDDNLVKAIEEVGLLVHRGSEKNVLERFYECIRLTSAKHFVRITGDCPFIDSKIIDQVINKYFSGNFDYCSNTIPPTYPDGLDVEIFSRDVLIKAYELCNDDYQKEHVTPWIRNNENFKIGNLKSNKDYSNLRLTVDEKIDLDLARKIVKYFNGSSSFDFDKIINLYQAKPEIFSTNIHIKRNEGTILNQGQKLWKRAKKVIPGGNMLLSKRPELFLPNIWPTYYKKAEGCKVWDLDENCFFDLSIMGIGTNLLGYCNYEVDDAVRKVISLSNMSTFNCPEDSLLAEKLVEMHPWAEMVRFARTGGEANSIAIRIARAASEREIIAICGYHGWHDWYLATNLEDTSNLESHLLPGLDPNGVPNSLKGTVKPFMFNDIDQLKKLVNKYNIAAVKMEVQRSTPPLPGFLQEVRKICDENNIILIFDECTSGFRETFGGIHLKYGVNPDMAIFGKALGNGYAITSVIGKKSIMEAAQSTFISSTFWTERIGPTAALKTLEIMNREKSWEYVTSLGLKLKKSIQEIADANELKISHNGIPALLGYTFENKKKLASKTYLTQEMLKRGFLASTICYVSTSHTEEIIEKYLVNLDQIFKSIKKYIDNESIEEHLDSEVCHSGFTRLN